MLALGNPIGCNALVPALHVPREPMKNPATEQNTSNLHPDLLPGAEPASQIGYWFYVGGVMVAMACAAVLITICARAQTVPVAPVESTPGATSTASMSVQASPTDVAKPAPKYSRRDIERAFGFMDTNQDGKISREEASGFRNVAKHFDAADTNKDNVLSLEEFGSALNRP